MSLRIDPEQRFACSQCGRCCRGFDVVVSAAEIDLYRRNHAAAWFREADGAEGTDREPFEPIPDMVALQRIRKRASGACGFLSPDNRCRIHEELGAANKPLTCRLFPFSFHPAADAIVVKASFGCPTVAANDGRPIGAGEPRAAIDALFKEWSRGGPSARPAMRLVAGREIDARTGRVLRDNFRAMLARDKGDLRSGIRRVAAAIDDLTRSRVVQLADAELSEYISLTVPHAATRGDAPAARDPGAIARLLQYGFLYAVVSIREDRAHPDWTPFQRRQSRLRLVAHFHGLAPRVGRVNVKALKRQRVDINHEDMRPLVTHYLRSTLETLGAGGKSIVDEIAVAASCLNAAIALAIMNAEAAGTTVNRKGLIEALTEASDVLHAQSRLLGWVLARLSADALWTVAS